MLKGKENVQTTGSNNLLEQAHDDAGVSMQQQHCSVTNKRRAVLGNGIAAANRLILETIATPDERALELHLVQRLAVLVVARSRHVSHKQLASSD